MVMGMFNCKNCLHNNVCDKFEELVRYMIENGIENGQDCFEFKDRTKYVKVVRCKDCKHFTEGMAVGMCKRIPDKLIIPMSYNAFCSFGERKE